MTRLLLPTAALAVLIAVPLSGATADPISGFNPDCGAIGTTGCVVGGGSAAVSGGIFGGRHIEDPSAPYYGNGGGGAYGYGGTDDFGAFQCVGGGSLRTAIDPGYNCSGE
ncbi:hypothetical protein AAII07_54370 [Microvirga sp. 0TCS3.31]